MGLAIAIRRLFSSIRSSIYSFSIYTYIIAWDNLLTFLNLIMPNRKIGDVIPKNSGLPGAGGVWPEWVAPGPGDSRCSCPALNALANHGILPHDGKDIPFKVLSTKIHETFRFAPSFCYFVPWFAAQFLQRDYGKDTMNLSDLDVHNLIEHDGSLLRWDAHHVPNQSIPADDLIFHLLSSATGRSKTTGEPYLTVSDLSKFTQLRRAHSKATNGQYTLSTTQRFFGSSNSGTLLLFFGGLVSDLEIFLKEERLPDGWESKVRSWKGMTMAKFNITAMRIELGIDEGKKVAIPDEWLEKVREMMGSESDSYGGMSSKGMMARV